LIDIPIKVTLDRLDLEELKPVDFVTLDMAEDVHIQIILGQTSLATIGVKVMLRED